MLSHIDIYLHACNLLTEQAQFLFLFYSLFFGIFKNLFNSFWGEKTKKESSNLLRLGFPETNETVTLSNLSNMEQCRIRYNIKEVHMKVVHC